MSSPTSFREVSRVMASRTGSSKRDTTPPTRNVWNIPNFETIFFHVFVTLGLCSLCCLYYISFLRFSWHFHLFLLCHVFTVMFYCHIHIFMPDWWNVLGVLVVQKRAVHLWRDLLSWNSDLGGLDFYGLAILECLWVHDSFIVQKPVGTWGMAKMDCAVVQFFTAGIFTCKVH